MKKRIAGMKKCIQEITILFKENVNSQKIHSCTNIQEIKDTMKSPKIRINAIVEGEDSQVKSTDNIVNKNHRRKFHSPKKKRCL